MRIHAAIEMAHFIHCMHSAAYTVSFHDIVLRVMSYIMIMKSPKLLHSIIHSSVLSVLGGAWARSSPIIKYINLLDIIHAELYR